ncbi:Crp/Fnr family transcriptional regulator [Aurantimonas marianensis]|uniref:Crp/Fnr family transcriptional regulator n=1 Tax=Aurantimonas marianensis TaxID=2920428 RepID=A0A9X2H2G6_9HYPH|nr:Crp/Fnr family transcriptional regulator [Aurantimonas marianensis]MCP3054037.1 Crp/Fnr family transcriptional regulator [Aurantimonas marianensis]
MARTSLAERQDIHNSEGPALCRACEARHRGICGALTPNQLVALSKHTARHAYGSDEELAATGDDVRRYANILSGVVKLTRLMADGRQQIVGLQFAPDFLGRPFKRQSDVSAEAATDVSVCSFPKSVIEGMIDQSPELGHRLHEQALKELDEARDWILTLGRKSATEKVASFLYLIASHVDPEHKAEDGPICFELPLKRADIADFLGLTIETVSRQITKLRKVGTIVVEHNRTVTVPDLRRLRECCEVDR